MVAVLFARSDSVYKQLPHLDVYDIDRDARTWPGGTPPVFLNSAIKANPPSVGHWHLLRSITMLKKIGSSVALFGLSVPAFAAADITAITAAQTDLLAYAAALLALGVAVWAALKVVRMFGGK